MFFFANHFYILSLYQGHSSKRISIIFDMQASPQECITIALTATTPTRDLDDPEYILSLIRATDYQVIPSYPASLAYDIDAILLRVLSVKEHRDVLIDLALPYRYQPPGRPQVIYFGRYIIFNQVILAVRLTTAPANSSSTLTQKKVVQKWPAGERAYHDVSPSIRKFYKQEGLDSFEQILVGDFFIRFRGVQIALLFESEITANSSILTSSCQRGCNILSVINDEPRLSSFTERLNHKTYKNRSRFQNELIRFGKNRKEAILYCGMRMATMDVLYLADSFIQQQGKIKEEGLFLFNDGSTISHTVNVAVTKLTDDLQVRDIAGPQATFKPIIDERAPVETLLTPNFNNLKKSLQMWYLFKQINKGTPFVFSLPMAAQCSELFEEIVKVATLISFPLPHIVVFYKRNQEYNPTREEKKYNLLIYESIGAFLSTSLINNICIYSEDTEEIEYLSTLVVFYRSKFIIKLCHRFLRPNQITQQNKIRILAEKLVQDSQLNMKSLLRQARKNRLSNDDLQQLMKTIKDKLRRSPIITPFFQYVINSTDEQLRAHMEDCEMALLTSGPLAFKVQHKQDQEMNQQTELNEYIQISDDEEVVVHRTRNPELTFQKKMAELKRFQDKQLKYKQNLCHSCSLLMNKQLSFNCPICQSKVCNPCIEKAFPNAPLKSKEDYEVCIVCRKLCNCVSCSKEVLEALMSQSMEGEREGQSQIQSCQICEIEGRGRQSIKIMCELCKELSCYLCQNNKKKIPFDVSKRVSDEWICDKCKNSNNLFRQAYTQTTIQEETPSSPRQFLRQQKKQRSDSTQKRERTRIKINEKSKRQNSRSRSNSKDKKSFKREQKNEKQPLRAPIKFFLSRKSRKSSSSSSSSRSNNSRKNNHFKDNNSSKSKSTERFHPHNIKREENHKNKSKHTKYQQTFQNYKKSETPNIKIEYKHIPVKKESVKQQTKFKQEKTVNALWGKPKANTQKPNLWKVEKPTPQKMDEESSNKYYFQTDPTFRY